MASGMFVRRLDANGDWVFGQSLGSYAFKNNAIALDIKMKIQSWLNNCIFDLAAGIDWATRLDKGQEQNLLGDLISIIGTVQGVVSVVQVSATLNDKTRVLTVNYSVQTIYSSQFTGQLAAAIGLVPA